MTTGGMGSHQSARSTTNTWFSPPAIVEALGGWESFDLDPASHIERPWPTAREHYTVEDNGLTRPWWGRVWLNPPYSADLVRLFLARMAEHGCGIALIFARTETDSFFRYVWERADGLLFLRGRLTFHRADGSAASANGGAPSVLIAYGGDDRDLLAETPIDGAFVPLRIPTAVVVAITATWAEALASFFHDRETVALDELYRAFSRHPKSRSNQHWREKLRQSLQRGAYERVEKGVWRKRGVA